MAGIDERGRGERGQVLVLVALGMVALVAMVGLVLDGGSTFGQRRSQQRGADLAALAGANDLLLHSNVATAESIAKNVATQNGYDPALVTVDVTVTPYARAGGKVKVDITARHQNSFSTIIGFNSWDVSVTATAVAGILTGGAGVGPIIFSAKDFQANGNPLPQYTKANCPPAPVTPPENGCPFGTQNGDAPAAGGQDLAWSNYGVGNVNRAQVAHIMSGELVIEKSIVLNEYIGQFNSGFHAELFDNTQDYLAGKDILVPITTEQVPGIPDGPDSCGGGTPAGGGCFQGWAVFHVVVAVKGSDKHIYGYFVSNSFAPGGTVDDCITNCPRSFGNNYALYLSE
jgi:hypothetical protein